MKNFKLIIALFLFTQLNFAQERKVFGVIVDSINNPIEGVTIEKKGSNTITKTNKKGEYSIKAEHIDTLVISFSGMKSRVVRSIAQKINIKLEGINIKENEKPIKHPEEFKDKRIEVITTKELVKTTNPNQYFERNTKYNLFIIYLPNYLTLGKKEMEFQKKYNITYLPFDKNYKRFFKKYNKLTFKFLDEKYDKTWQNEIRKDAVGLNNYLK